MFCLADAASGRTFATTASQDWNFWLVSLAAEKQLDQCWSIKGDAVSERDRNDKKLGLRAP